MRGSLAGPRVLLRRLREAMADPVGAQQRLDKIVVLIASNMVAEVCSVYLLREGNVLELYATEGLNREAVHITRLKVGEGLVGAIAQEAETLNLTEAQEHPAFAYRPETGEEIYHSFLGVPILRGGHMLGVLVVQNAARRVYSEEEIEALQTTAMVLAEMVAAGEFAMAPALPPEARRTQPLHMHGISLSDGIALGHAVMHEPKVVVTNLIAEDVGHEAVRLARAMDALRGWADDIVLRGDVARAGEHRDVLEAFRMLAHDRGWARRMQEAVATGLTAEAAVERVQSDTRARMMRQTDPYLRERLHDLDDLSNRLLRILTGKALTAAGGELPKDAIIVARKMGPAELLDYERDNVRGLVLEEAGPNSHVAIVARALGIAAVSGTQGVVDAAEQGAPMIVDGIAAQVHIRPPADVENAYADKVRLQAKRRAHYARLRDKPARSRDGQDVTLMINAGLLVELPHLDQTAAAGIGLYRTEFQFMVSARFPRMSEQQKTYTAVLDAAGGKPVVFRTLDVGGDKVMPFLRQAHEENPALGWRAIRMALDRPALMRTQLRALLRAGAGRSLAIMFPMITEVDEFDAAKKMVASEIAYLRRHKHAIAEDVKLGAMIEVPALLLQLDALMAKVDFVSVGSNDLLQYLWAADRGNVRVANRFDPLSPAILSALKLIADKAGKHKVPLTLCGELAGRPLTAMALLALGYRSISMAPASIGPVKAMLRDLDIGALEVFLLPAIEQGGNSIRKTLREFARKNRIAI